MNADGQQVVPATRVDADTQLAHMAQLLAGAGRHGAGATADGPDLRGVGPGRHRRRAGHADRVAGGRAGRRPFTRQPTC
jgi:hypothetical protein